MAQKKFLYKLLSWRSMTGNSRDEEGTEHKDSKLLSKLYDGQLSIKA